MKKFIRDLTINDFFNFCSEAKGCCLNCRLNDADICFSTLVAVANSKAPLNYEVEVPEE